MSGTAFVDTNVLIYAATGRISEPRKCSIARELIATEMLGLSGQVMAEFVGNVRNAQKMKHPLTFEETLAWVERLEAFPFVAVDRALVKLGLLLSQRFGISYWDGAILAGAQRLSAKTLYTEDLNHDQHYGAVRVVNPFRAN